MADRKAAMLRADDALKLSFATESTIPQSHHWNRVAAQELARSRGGYCANWHQQKGAHLALEIACIHRDRSQLPELHRARQVVSHQGNGGGANGLCSKVCGGCRLGHSSRIWVHLGARARKPGCRGQTSTGPWQKGGDNQPHREDDVSKSAKV